MHSYGMSACDRPRSDSGFACPHLGIQHHELDPAPRKIDPQHDMPVEATARQHVAVPSPDRTRPDGAMIGARRHLASWQGQEGPFAAPSLRSTSLLAVRRCAHGSAKGEQARMDLGCAWSVARELFVQPAGGPLRPCGSAARLFGRAAAQRSDAAAPR